MSKENNKLHQKKQDLIAQWSTLCQKRNRIEQEILSEISKGNSVDVLSISYIEILGKISAKDADIKSIG